MNYYFRFLFILEYTMKKMNALLIEDSGISKDNPLLTFVLFKLIYTYYRSILRSTYLIFASKHYLKNINTF